MMNCEMTVIDNILTIKVDIKKSFGPSKSKKTIVVASTKGNKPVEDTGCIIGLNVYKYPKEEEEE